MKKKWPYLLIPQQKLPKPPFTSIFNWPPRRYSNTFTGRGQSGGKIQKLNCHKSVWWRILTTQSKLSSIVWQSKDWFRRQPFKIWSSLKWGESQQSLKSHLKISNWGGFLRKSFEEYFSQTNKHYGEGFRLIPGPYTKLFFTLPFKSRVEETGFRQETFFVENKWMFIPPSINPIS